MTAIRDLAQRSTRSATPAWPSCCRRGRASPSAWAPAEPATAPRRSMHAFADAIDQRGLDIASGADRLLRLLRRGAAGQCLACRASRWSSCTACRPDHVEPDPRRPGRRRPFPPTWRCARSRSGTISPRRSITAPASRTSRCGTRCPSSAARRRSSCATAGLINPDDIEEYIAVGGYQALYKVLIDGTPEAANEQIKQSRLRGRGGAGYSTG